MGLRRCCHHSRHLRRTDSTRRRTDPRLQDKEFDNGLCTGHLLRQRTTHSTELMVGISKCQSSNLVLISREIFSEFSSILLMSLKTDFSDIFLNVGKVQMAFIVHVKAIRQGKPAF